MNKYDIVYLNTMIKTLELMYYQLYSNGIVDMSFIQQFVKTLSNGTIYVPDITFSADNSFNVSYNDFGTGKSITLKDGTFIGTIKKSNSNDLFISISIDCGNSTEKYSFLEMEHMIKKLNYEIIDTQYMSKTNLDVINILIVRPFII